MDLRSALSLALGVVVSLGATPSASAQPLVSMPLPCGDSATVTQGVGGSVSHTGGQFFSYDLGIGGSSFPVAAAEEGTVAAIYNRDGAACSCCGSCTDACRGSVRAVIVRHAEGFYTGYYHLSSIRVREGDHVDRGDRLGMSGQTGHSCGIHLHFQAQTTAALWGPSRDLRFREAGGGRLVTGRSYRSESCCPDGDGDGHDDCSDNCPGMANRGQVDLDDDGRGDVCDGDDDGDGVSDGRDNCPRVANGGQADRDGDGRGNACDGDDDGDGVRDDVDNCPGLPNRDQANFNDDREGDVCDDTDDDGIRDHRDNCRREVNRGQADLDDDGRGDVCDGDRDGDGVPNERDDCPGVANTDQADLDEDTRGDACDSDDDGDGRADEEDNCLRLANPDQRDGDGDGRGDACDDAPSLDGGVTGVDGGVVGGDGGAMARDGGAMARDGGAMARDGGAGPGHRGSAGGCSASPGRGGSWLWLVVGLAVVMRRRLGAAMVLVAVVLVAGCDGGVPRSVADERDAGLVQVVDGGSGDGGADDGGALAEVDAPFSEEPIEPDPVDPDPVEPDPAAPAPATSVERTYRVLHWNVAGSKIHHGDTDTGLIEAIVAGIVDHDAHFVGLNELCHTQFTALQRALTRRGWPEDADRFSYFVAARPAGGPRCHGESYGNAIFSRLPLGRADRFTWPSDGSDEDRVMVCAPLRELGHMRFCSTHLTHLGGVTRQMLAALAQLERYDDAGDTVIFAGDLNIFPREEVMDRVYSSEVSTPANGGNVGRYHELDDDDREHCRGYGERTTPNADGGPCGEGIKIDYLFVRQNRIAGAYSADSRDIPRTCGGPCSDHRMLTGRVAVRVRR